MLELKYKVIVIGTDLKGTTLYLGTTHIHLMLELKYKVIVIGTDLKGTTLYLGTTHIHLMLELKYNVIVIGTDLKGTALYLGTEVQGDCDRDRFERDNTLFGDYTYTSNVRTEVQGDCDRDRFEWDSTLFGDYTYTSTAYFNSFTNVRTKIAFNQNYISVRPQINYCRKRSFNVSVII